VKDSLQVPVKDGFGRLGAFCMRKNFVDRGWMLNQIASERASDDRFGFKEIKMIDHDGSRALGVDDMNFPAQLLQMECRCNDFADGLVKSLSHSRSLICHYIAFHGDFSIKQESF